MTQEEFYKRKTLNNIGKWLKILSQILTLDLLIFINIINFIFLHLKQKIIFKTKNYKCSQQQVDF
jgi:hypothetical protein